jgi:TonB family protein
MPGSAEAGESKQEKGWAILQQGGEVPLNRTRASPYRLEASFTFARPDSEAIRGSYKLTWISAERWRREISVSNFQELAVGGKNKKWIQRSLAVQPLLVHRLNSAVEFLQSLGLDEGDKVTKVSEQKRNGSTLQCVASKSSLGLERTFCFDPGTGALASVHNGAWLFEYSEAQKHGARLVPTRIRVSEDGRLRVQVEVEHIGDPNPADDGLFAAPAHAQEWADCEKPLTGKLVQRVAPEYPDRARQSHQEGTVVLYDVISTDGRLESIKIIQTAGAALDQAAMDAVKQWKYAPTTCAGVPIRVEGEIQVNFELAR